MSQEALGDMDDSQMPAVGSRREISMLRQWRSQREWEGLNFELVTDCTVVTIFSYGCIVF